MAISYRNNGLLIRYYGLLIRITNPLLRITNPLLRITNPLLRIIFSNAADTQPSHATGVETLLDLW